MEESAQDEEEGALAGAPEGEQGGPLSREQTRQVVDADRRLTKILFAAKVASFNGWTLAVCAVLCLPFALFSPWTSLVAAGLAVAAYFELHGRTKLRALDPGGARVLAINQMAILVGVYLYCGVNLYLTLSGPAISEQLQQDPALSAMLGATGDPGVDEMLDGMVGGVDALVQTIAIVFYAAVAGLSTLVQGGMAIFYLSRRRTMIEYLASTPGWILDLQHQRR